MVNSSTRVMTNNYQNTQAGAHPGCRFATPEKPGDLACFREAQ